MRGRLYEDDYQPRLSGHETFPLRYGWLKKAFDVVEETESAGNERSVFLADEAIARFGVGRNMVASMRHWATSVGIIEEDGRTVSPLGRYLFGHHGLDPYMEAPATTWLVHWRLCGNPRNTTWYWTFNHYAATTFDRDTLVRGVEKLAKDRHWTRASTSTIKNDVACLLRTYVSRDSMGKCKSGRFFGIPTSRAWYRPSDGKTGWFSTRARTKTYSRSRRLRMCSRRILDGPQQSPNPVL